MPEKNTDIELRKKIEKRLNNLQQEFDSNWKPHYKELVEYEFPNLGRFLEEKANDGKKRHGKVVNGTPEDSLDILAAGMQSGLTSRSRPWFNLTVRDKSLAKYKPVREWLNEVQRRMMAVFDKSNFYNATHTGYMQLGGFGTGAFLVEEDYQNVIRCYPYTTGEYVLDTDFQLRPYYIGSVHKRRSLNVQEFFGEKNCSDTVNNNVKNGNGHTWVDVAHVIERNTGRKLGKIDGRNKPFRSVWFEHKKKGMGFLRFSGYEELPVMAFRWLVSGSEVYGRSPGMRAFPDARSLYKFEEKSYRAIDKEIDPPLKASPGLKNKKIRTGSNAINYLDEEENVEELYKVKYNIEAAEMKIQRLEEKIQKRFYNDLFLFLANANSQQTAYEVAKRYEEKLRQLGPVLDNLLPEMINPAVTRVFNIMLRLGLLPPPPMELWGIELLVEVVSLLAQAQKMLGLSAVEQTVGFVGRVSEAFPQAADKLNVDKAIDEYADMSGAPASIINSEKEVAAIREARIQQIQQEKQAERLERVVQGAKTLSETNTESNNALTALMGAQGA